MSPGDCSSFHDAELIHQLVIAEKALCKAAGPASFKNKPGFPINEIYCTVMRGLDEVRVALLQTLKETKDTYG